MRRVLVLLLVLATTSSARADDDPSNGKLLLAGAGMAVPTYLLGVIWHEGTHALVAKGFGAELLEVRLYPNVYEGHFYFGLTRWRGPMSDGERAFTLLAPKLTDTLLLLGYTFMVASDELPANDYLSLACTVLATGAWVDFAKDVVSRNPTNDVVKVYRIYGRDSEWQRLPWRLVQASVSVAAAFVLVRGYEDVFGDDASAPPMLLQLASGTF